MKHNWKVGDAYTTKGWKELGIVGRITKVGMSRVEGSEVWFCGAEIQFRSNCWRTEGDLIPLVPEPMHSGQTINDLYATVDEVICRNQEADCAPPCPKHAPIDPFEGFDSNIQYS